LHEADSSFFRVQCDLETESLRDGLEKYDRQQSRLEPSDTGAGALLLIRVVETTAEAIRREQERLDKSKWSKLRGPLLSIAPDKLALISLRSILNLLISKGSKGQYPIPAVVASAIGRSCLAQRQYDIHHAQSRPHEGEPSYWKETGADVILGLKLLTVVVGNAVVYENGKALPVFELTTVIKGSRAQMKTPTFLRLTSTATNWLERGAIELRSLAVPMYLPMVVKPQGWTGLKGGSYFTFPDLNLVKRGSNRKIRSALNKADLSVVLKAVNALQNTPWRINRGVYDVMCQYYNQFRTAAESLRKGSSIGESFVTELDQKKTDPSLVRFFDAKTQSRIILERFRPEICKRFAEFERFYFPYQLDHRGRAYCVPQIFHPQADDLGRALLEFADPKPLGTRGAYWLAVQIANLSGYNKVSFQRRVEWAYENEDAIIEFARNPLSEHQFWKIDRHPWCLLAACREWEAYRRTGSGFESRLPILIDGTCNGLQHLSAMGRDPVVGKATNLIPGNEPEDIYRWVADRASKENDARAQQGKTEALEWAGKIDRGIAKVATMPAPYGITRQGIQEGLIAEIKEREERGLGPFPSRRGTMSYLAGILEKSVAEVIVKGTEIMKWLRRVTSNLAEHNCGPRWTVPSGFVVVHEERKPQLRRIDVPGCTIRVPIENTRGKLNKKKQRDGIAANFVHSFDAAHMMLTFTSLSAQGLTHFAAIHDGFGVHASDVDTLGEALRDQFVHIYQGSVLEEFANEQRRNYPHVRIDDPPLIGKLDVGIVRDSAYFFS
jgi:DNA-directed RNA polymerase